MAIVDDGESEKSRRDAKSGGAGLGILTNVLGGAVLPAVAFITAPIMAHALGVEGRGQVAAATAPFQLMGVVALLGLPEAVTHFVAKATIRYTHTFALVVLLTLSSGLVSSGAIYLLRGWLSGGSPHLARLIALGAAPLPVYLLLGLTRGLASGLQRWHLIALEQAVFGISRLLLVVALWVTGHLTPLTGVAVFVLSPLLGGLAYLPLLRASLPDPTGREPTRHVLQYGLRVWAGSISGVLLYRLDQSIMTPLSDSQNLGLYVVAASVGDLPQIVVQAFYRVAFSTESSNPSDQHVCVTARTCFLASSALCGLMTAAVPLGIPIVFGSQFARSVIPTVILLLGVVSASIGVVLEAALAGRGRPGAGSASLAAACLVNILALALLVPRLGAVGAALATVAGSSTMTCINLSLFERYYPGNLRNLLIPRWSDVVSLCQGGRNLWPGRRSD